MKDRLKTLTSDSSFAENLKQYNAKDSALALVLFAFFILVCCVLAVANTNPSLSNNGFIGLGFAANVLSVFITLLFLKAKKQGISTIGLTGGNWKASCLIGVILAVILFFLNCGQYLLLGKKLVEGGRLIILAFYYLSVSVCEEVIFRGYIGTRLGGLVKKHWISVTATGLLFVVMHFPFQMIAYGTPLRELVAGDISWLVNLFVTHMVFSIIYSKTNSLYGAIIPHWMSNLAYAIVVR